MCILFPILVIIVYFDTIYNYFYQKGGFKLQYKGPEDGKIQWSSAPICNVFDIKKSERTSYREVVRNFHVWWEQQGSNL